MESARPEASGQIVKLIESLSNSLAEESIPPCHVTELPADCFNPVGVFAELTDVFFGGLVKRRSVLSQRRADDEPPASDFFGAELLCEQRIGPQDLPEAAAVKAEGDQVDREILTEEFDLVLNERPPLIDPVRR